MLLATAWKGREQFNPQSACFRLSAHILERTRTAQPTICTQRSTHRLERTRTAQTKSLHAASYSLERTRKAQPAVCTLLFAHSLERTKTAQTHSLHTANCPHIAWKGQGQLKPQSAFCWLHTAGNGQGQTVCMLLATAWKGQGQRQLKPTVCILLPGCTRGSCLSMVRNPGKAMTPLHSVRVKSM